MAMTAVDFADKYGMSVASAQDTMDRYVADPSNPEFGSVAGIMQNATGVNYTGSTGIPTPGTPPYTEIPPPVYPATTGGTNVPITEGVSPFTQYMQRLGLGAGGYFNPAQRYQAQQYDPLRWLYGQAQTYAPLMQTQPGQWGDYIGTAAGQMGQIGQGAQNILGSLFGASPTQRMEQGLTYEPYLDPMTGEMTYGGEGAQGMNQLQDLLSMALRGAWGPQGAGRFAQRAPAEQQQWQLQYPGGQGQNFIDYIRSKYNLGQFI